MEIAVFFVAFMTAVAFASGLLASTAWRAALMGAIVSFVASAFVPVIQGNIVDWEGIYLIAIRSLPAPQAVAVMAFTVAKLKRQVCTTPCT